MFSLPHTSVCFLERIAITASSLITSSKQILFRNNIGVRYANCLTTPKYHTTVFNGTHRQCIFATLLHARHATTSAVDFAGWMHVDSERRLRDDGVLKLSDEMEEQMEELRKSSSIIPDNVIAASETIDGYRYCSGFIDNDDDEDDDENDCDVGGGGGGYTVRRWRGNEAPTVVIDDDVIHEALAIEKSFSEQELCHSFEATVHMMKVSPDTHLAAFLLDCSGSGDCFTLFVRDLRTQRLLSMCISNVRSMVWDADSRNIIYTQIDPKTLRTTAVLRRSIEDLDEFYGDVTFNSDEDEILYEENDERFFLDVTQSKDKKVIFITSSSKTSSEVRLFDAKFKDNRIPPLSVIREREENVQYYVEHINGMLYLLHNIDKPNTGLCVSYVLRNAPILSQWKPAFSSSSNEDYVILDAEFFTRFIILFGLVDAVKPIVLVYTIGDSGGLPHNGLPHRLEFGPGTLTPSKNSDIEHSQLSLSFSSPVSPEIMYECDLQTGELKEKFRHEKVEAIFKDYVINTTSATSIDGVNVPITLIHGKGVCYYTANTPVIMIGYGAYGELLPVNFSYSFYPLLKRGVVIALCHVRGGGEYGPQWYNGGAREAKLNSFHDWIACAESLIKRGLTSPSRLGAYGASAGALLVAGAMNMRPDLFRAVVLSVPFVDVLTPLTKKNAPLSSQENMEFGDPLHDIAALSRIRSYDPMTTFSTQEYPSVFISPARDDSRISLDDVIKYTRRLKSYQSDKSRLPILYQLEGGHTSGTDDDEDESFALQYAFLLHKILPRKK